MPPGFQDLPANQFAFTTDAEDVSVECDKEGQAVFTTIVASTDATIENLIARRPWGMEYCRALRAEVARLVRDGGEIRIVGESRSEEPGEKPAFGSIFDHMINSRGECVGYFDHSCPHGTSRFRWEQGEPR